MPLFIDATQVQVASGGAPVVVPHTGSTLDIQQKGPPQADTPQDQNNTTDVVTDTTDTANVTTTPVTEDPTLTVGPTNQPVTD